MAVYDRARRYLKAKGPAAAAAQVFRFTAKKVFPLETAALRRRKLLGQELHRKYGGVVQRGPLAGFKLGGDSTWAAPDLGPMLLGTYEQNIVAKLAELRADTLVDVGAADGYFGVGCVKAGLFDRSICFEMDPVTRSALKDAASLNGVGEKVIVLGTASSSFVDELAEYDLDRAKTVFLFDIEGGEFELLSKAVLQAVHPAPLIIELHDDLFRGHNRRDRLAHDASDLFDVSFIDYGARDPMSDPLLADYPEDDRWLLTSEGRMYQQAWMILTPKAGSAG